MTTLSILIGYLWISFAASVIDDSLRPGAIIPWSEYQRRIRTNTSLASPGKSSFGQHRKTLAGPTEMSLQQAALEEIAKLKREQEQREFLQKSSGFVIRPQNRKKISEPADFHRIGVSRAQPAKEVLVPPQRVPPHYNPPISPEQYPYQKLNNLPSPPPQYNTQAVQRPSNANDRNYANLLTSSQQQQFQNIIRDRMEKPKSSYEKTLTQKKVDGLRVAQVPGQLTPTNPSGGNQHMMTAQQYQQQQLRQTNNQHSVNGMPFGVLRNGVPSNTIPISREVLNGLGARQFGAANFVDPSIPVETFNQVAPHFSRITPALSQPIDQSSGNIVNAIFSQSQQRPFVPLQSANSVVPGIQQVPLGSQAGATNPLDQLLASGSPLEQISKIAKNLFLNGGGGEGGQNDLLTAGLRALQQQGGNIESAATETRSSPSMMEKLLSGAAQAINHGLKEQQRQAKIDAIKKDQQEKNKIDEEKERSISLLEGIPDDQRSLLEAAIRSGELDPEMLKPALKTLVKEDTKEESKKEKESRLLEWIQQNRPKQEEAVVASDKLPYYGKYCGSLVEQHNKSNKTFNPVGAVWAVDERRLIVSKFYFVPGSILTENVTFWGGPNMTTNDPVVDMFPSKNGFYLRPQKIDISIFAIAEVPAIEAKIRKTIPANITVNGATPVQPVNGEENDRNKTTPVRRKRDAIIHVTKDEMPPPKTQKNDDGTIHLVVKGGMVKFENPDMKTEVINISSSDEYTPFPKVTSTPIFQTEFPQTFRIKQPEEDPLPDPLIPSPLEWHAGFQPLLLTLPDYKTIKTSYWISLRDHKREETVASVMFPNGPAFNVPSVIRLRSLSPNKKDLLSEYDVSSGAIMIIDMKTMIITDLKIKSNGAPLWFMFGKEIMPNANGHIIPVYDSKTGIFDCDSLRDYNGETVTLRLPGTMDVKDVFWLSVFSMTTAVSYSHIFVPYNNVHPPPDLQGISTPHCKWTSP